MKYLICEQCKNKVYENDAELAVIDGEGNVFCDDACLMDYARDHSAALEDEDWESAYDEEEIEL
jgi:hypothetical protein